jgi:hypothetical protein
VARLGLASLPSQGSGAEIAVEEVIYALGSSLDVERVPGVAQHACRLEAGDARIEEIELNAAPALLIRSGGRPLVAIMIDTDEERIRAVSAVSTRRSRLRRCPGHIPVIDVTPGRPAAYLTLNTCLVCGGAPC